ncbi:transcriptional repressor [Oxynema sp. CENA135]|uniref:Fur family transcriptional regulator n=1 Tax=Oxynema sp. CENA135 TaxID=984206 RepID=UPI00190CBB1C|nr:Fur family transcriptional regulator [Oxynema sp. CENA135]MBK4731918.1 transcriptional repressor [Oxynema sp. CENA135]
MKKETTSAKPIRSLDDALHRCQSLGMRLSRQRRYILELLWQAQEHLCAREIYDRLNQAGKAIGHTSVYQNLEALSSQGIIECIERSDGRLYGNISDSHSHVNCLQSNRLLDVYVELPPEIIERVERETGVRIVDYRINFYGYSVEDGQTKSQQGIHPPDERTWIGDDPAADPGERPGADVNANGASV